MDALELALARVKEESFRDATPLAMQAIDEAARGKRDLRATADELAGLMPVFNHASRYARALPFYEAVAGALCPLLARGDSARVRCMQNLALVLATVDRMADAERLRREAFEELDAARPPNDDARVRALNEVACALRTRGDHAGADALFAKLPICEHLQPVREELLRSGARIGTGGHLWSGTAIWLWFNLVLDPEALQRKLALDACVSPTENDDPRSGPELGLRCTIHGDGIVGPHPKFV
jgi:hypothetical protein